MTDIHLSEAGKFGKPHGIKGEIAAIFDFDDLSVEPGDFVFAEIDGLAVPFRVVSVRSKGAGFLLSLYGIADEKDAEMLANKPIFMELEDIEDADDEDGQQVYLEDLTGFSIWDNGMPIGVIEDYSEPTPHNPLFVVRRKDGDTIYVPAHEELIVDINFENKTIDMDLPEGLVDLNSSN